MKLVGAKWSCILTIISLVMPSWNWIDWSAIYNYIYVGYKGSLPNKYSYVTLDIMLTPDPISQKVLMKILCPMVHSIIGTLGSSFLARNGEARRWSYSDQSVLIMLTDSSGDCLILFFLLFRLFFFLVTVVSSGRYAFCGWLGDCKIHFLKENFSFLSLIVKQIFALSV
jgi:hypothetical protein